MPVNCLLGNDLEHTIRKVVDLRSHLEMVGFPGWVLMTTRSMAARQGSQKDREPETVAQVPARKRRDNGMGNLLQKLPWSGRRLNLRVRPLTLQGKTLLPWETCLN